MQAGGIKRPVKESRQALELSDSIFPSITVSRGSYRQLGPCLGLEDSLLFAGSSRSRALHWHKLLASFPAIKQLRQASLPAPAIKLVVISAIQALEPPLVLPPEFTHPITLVLGKCQVGKCQG